MNARNAPFAHLAARPGLLAVTTLIVCALTVAVLGWVGARASAPEPSHSQRGELVAATRDAVEAVLSSSGPDDGSSEQVTDRLTTPLAEEYAAYGIGIALPGAGVTPPVAGAVVVHTRVLEAGIVDYRPDVAHVLVFADQVVEGIGSAGISSEQGSDAESDSGQRNPLTRRAIMRNVDGRWLLADLEEVGDITG